MEGVLLFTAGTSSVVVIETLSEEVKDLIRARLSAVCHGAVRAAEDEEFYSYTRTVAEFLRRFDPKPKKIQTGMIGELLVHVFAGMTFPSFASGAVFFNKEERSMKKGFDLTFHDESRQELWYAEVKSSVSKKHDGDPRSKNLLKTAAADLRDRLSAGDRQSTWLAALIDADLALQDPAAASMKALLKLDSISAEDGSLRARRAILAAAVFHPQDPCTLSIAAALTLSEVEPQDSFTAVRTIAFQQSAIAEVVEFLRTEAA